MAENVRMGRSARTARGVFAALTATLLAAASHSLAGGSITPLAVIATTLVALPLCVSLAGKLGSLWRLALGVCASQLLYHWSFAGLGAAADGGTTVPGHAGHMGAMLPLLPASFAHDPANSSTVMWFAHAVAAVSTIALLHRGEHALIRFVRVLRETVPVWPLTRPALPKFPAILEFFVAAAPRPQQAFLSAISYRGPPASALSH